MAFDLTFEYVLLTSPKHVMELLTDTKLLRAWSGGEAILENKVRGKFMMFDNWVSGTVLKTSETELSYTWILEEWPEGTVSEVHYKLDKHPQGTRITLTQTGLPTEEEKEEHLRGWTDFFFEPMEEYMLITGTK